MHVLLHRIDEDVDQMPGFRFRLRSDGLLRLPRDLLRELYQELVTTLRETRALVAMVSSMLQTGTPSIWTLSLHRKNPLTEARRQIDGAPSGLEV